MDQAHGFQKAQTQMESNLLMACSNSDIPALTQILESRDSLKEIDFGCVDLLGRTALQLTVENEDIEAVKLLLPHCKTKNIENCLLFAINLSKEKIAMAMLKHPRCQRIYKGHQMKVMKGTQDKFEPLPNDSQFPRNTTPLVLAAERNLYEVVRHLLIEKHRISVPHSVSCPCDTCVQKSGQDYFRFAHERLNAYRGLASESYISLSSVDPIKDTFSLRKTMLTLAEREEHFKKEYCDLANSLSAFSVKLLNKVMGDSELDIILDKVGRPDQDEFAPLGRLRLAVKLGVKEFVAHPSSQMRLRKMWYQGFPRLSRGSLLQRFLICIGFLLGYPFIALAYIFLPGFEFIQFIKAPCAKFMAHVLFYVILLSQLLATTAVTSPYAEVPVDWEVEWNATIAQKYLRTSADGSFRVRSGHALTIHYLIVVWVVGLLWQEVKELYRDGWEEYVSSFLNFVDALMLISYFVSFGFRFYAVAEINKAVQYFLDTPSFFDLLEYQDITARQHYKWLNPDRFYWDVVDPVIIAEGLFAIANVLDFMRFAAYLPAFKALGTLQISFGIMLKEIFRFLGLFGLVFLAFMVSLANLFWFYRKANRTAVELAVHTATTAEEAFGNLGSTFMYGFWSLFGMGERNAPEISTFKEIPFTEVIGYILYMVFMVCCALVLLNLFIAMMSLSFSEIQDDADVEWKFSRTQLLFGYMKPGLTLPVPLNLFPTPKSIAYLVIFLYRFLKKRNFGFKSCCTRSNLRISPEVLPEKSLPDDEEIDEGQTEPQSPAETGVFDNTSGNSRYKEVMSQIVRRFINEATSVKDEDKDDENLKQDLLRIRRELTNALEMRAREIEQCRKDVMTSRATFIHELSVCMIAIQQLDTKFKTTDGVLSKILEKTEAVEAAQQRFTTAPITEEHQVTTSLTEPGKSAEKQDSGADNSQ
ncbi:short transient receptor potential channel 7-like [Liolophura sinensis]|uniref:short transient receptor potential channel 7-like n=1 Tax=Liolophura sinensis TaxID=3198878 RepID=UPI003159603B